MKKNIWLNQNKKIIDNIKRFLTECQFSAEYNSIPHKAIYILLNGMENEILRLEKEIEDKENIIDGVRKELESIQNMDEINDKSKEKK